MWLPLIFDRYSSYPCRRRLRQKQRAKSKTADNISEITKARRLLLKRIRELQACQRIYIPGIADLLSVNQEDERLQDQPEVLKLWLPSQLSDDDRSAWCLPGIPYLEFRFRYARASDSLAELRRLRRLFQGTRDQNAKHTKSTSSTTRSQGILDSFHSRIKRVASRYRDARRALLALDPNGKLDAGWKHCFLELKDSDIRGPDREAHEPSEGRFKQSWIWTVSHPPSDSPGSIASGSQPSVASPTSPHEQPASSTVIPGGGSDSSAVDTKEQDQSHRAHWARTQARAEQYEEEVKLTVEEMGRTLKYFKWKSLWWQTISSERSRSDNPPSPGVQDGLRAYAHRQSNTYNKLIALFVNHWYNFLSAHSLGSSWLSSYPLNAHPVPPARPRRGHRSLDADLPTTTRTSRRPAAPSETASSISEGGTVPRKSASQPETPFMTPEDATDAPLDSGSSEDDSDDDYDFTQDDSWDERSDYDEGSDYDEDSDDDN